MMTKGFWTNRILFDTMKQVNKMELQDIEKSIIKKYRKEIWSKFVNAIKEYDLIQENDKIAICISGGKDSFLLAKCMQELKKHGKFQYELEFLVMNPGYSKETMERIEENLKKLGIKAHIFESDIFAVSTELDGKNPCYFCAKMRRGYLYRFARELGCNKIALGHHFNDVVETILLNIIYNGQYSSMMPKLHSDHFEGMELIRPLYLIREKDIIHWTRYNDLTFIDCACSVTKKSSGKRKVMKELVESLNEIYVHADQGILNSTKHVNMNTILGYHKGEEEVSFLDYYDEKKKS